MNAMLRILGEQCPFAKAPLSLWQAVGAAATAPGVVRVPPLPQALAQNEAGRWTACHHAASAPFPQWVG